MKIVAYQTAPQFADKTSRLAGCKVKLEGVRLDFNIPIYGDGEGPSLIVEDFKAFSFDLNELLELSEDHGYILISGEQESNPAFSAEQVILTTYQSKSIPLQYKSDKLRLAWLITPHKGCSLEDATLLLYDDGQIDLSSLTIDETVADLRYRAFPVIGIDGPSTVSPGDSVSLSVTQAIPGAVIYLQTTAGVLNKSRLSSSGTVQITAQGLDSGDQIKIKAGYRHWTGDAEHIITVQ